MGRLQWDSRDFIVLLLTSSSYKHHYPRFLVENGFCIYAPIHSYCLEIVCQAHRQNDSQEYFIRFRFLRELQSTEIAYNRNNHMRNIFDY